MDSAPGVINLLDSKKASIAIITRHNKTLKPTKQDFDEFARLLLRVYKKKKAQTS